MRPAHHAANLVAGARKPQGQMAADGARAENTDAHGISCSRMGAPVSTSRRSGATRHVMRLTRRAAAESDGSEPATFAIVPAATTKKRDRDAGQPSPVESR